MGRKSSPPPPFAAIACSWDEQCMFCQTAARWTGDFEALLMGQAAAEESMGKAQ